MKPITIDKDFKHRPDNFSVDNIILQALMMQETYVSLLGIENNEIVLEARPHLPNLFGVNEKAV